MTLTSTQRVRGALAMVAIVAAWQLLTGVVFTGNFLWPPPSRILESMWTDGFQFYSENLRTTSIEAGKGYALGNLSALLVALAVVLVPWLERPVVQVSVVLNAIPIVAVGPILVIVMTGDHPKVALAVLAVFLTTLIGALLGLHSASRTQLDVVRAYGGGTLAEIRKVRVIAALPSIMTALKIAAPAAVLGAIVGEYLGGDSGLGVAMINSQQSLDVARTWGLVLVATALGSIVYGLVELISRLFLPWAMETK